MTVGEIIQIISASGSVITSVTIAIISAIYHLSKPHIKEKRNAKKLRKAERKFLDASKNVNPFGGNK